MREREGGGDREYAQTADRGKKEERERERMQTKNERKKRERERLFVCWLLIVPATG